MNTIGRIRNALKISRQIVGMRLTWVDPRQRWKPRPMDVSIALRCRRSAEVADRHDRRKAELALVRCRIAFQLGKQASERVGMHAQKFRGPAFVALGHIKRLTDRSIPKAIEIEVRQTRVIGRAI